MRFKTLGTTELCDPTGRPIESILTQPKRLALLAYLCIARPTGFRRREELLALFWPESDETRSRSALSQSLHRLRQGVGKDVILTRGPDEVGVDLTRLECDVPALDRALADGRIDAVLELYRGELLPGLTVDDAPAVERWLDAERSALASRVAAGAWTGVERARREGSAADAERWARRAVDLAPYDEAGVRRCMALLAESGNLAGAVQCFEELDRRLRSDLDVAPSVETVALLETLKQARALSRRSPPAVISTPLTLQPATQDQAALAAETAGSRGDAPRWTWSRALRLPVLGTALVAAGAVALVLAIRQPRATQPPAARRVLVLPFSVRGDSSLAFLREGLVDLLSTRLDGVAGVQALDPSTVLTTREPPADGSLSGQAR
ncbi:MAG TPA: BTAD domain-containing putative transcriptional regulator, partial [Gemmatimonadales bacterium]|nr:BTAD domain-containing putative transcriptional regulator [Gemmatimonadales bacterium]